MPWSVQITWEGDDRRLLEDLLGAFDATLTEVEETLCVTSARFDALGSAAEVCELAQRLAAAFRLSADANPGIEIKIGTAVYEMAADGKVAKNAFTTASFRGGGRMILTGFAPTILIQPADHLSEAEKEAARARQAETEYQARLVRISTRVRLRCQRARSKGAKAPCKADAGHDNHEFGLKSSSQQTWGEPGHPCTSKSSVCASLGRLATQKPLPTKPATLHQSRSASEPDAACRS